MSKFIKVDAVDSGLLIFINVEDISYIEGNTVRMKSLATRKSEKWVGRKNLQLETTSYLEQEHFDLTTESIKRLLLVLEII